MNQIRLRNKWLALLFTLSGFMVAEAYGACPDTPESPTEVTVVSYLGSRVQLRWKNVSISGVAGKTQCDIYRNGVKIETVDYVSGTYQYAYAAAPMPGTTVSGFPKCFSWLSGNGWRNRLLPC